ncbi:helix-turn-helix transcriptional regulator [bacterium]|nr:helix-turn-helix transcriptional regulator [bacterium]
MDDKELLKIIAHNIKIERAIKSMTQSQLAELIGVHEKYIGVIEAGKQNITLKTLNKIANSFNIEISKLFEIRK